MNEFNKRMIDKSCRPADVSVRKWVGEEQYKYWEEIVGFIGEMYPGVFNMDDWIYGGAKHGWSLRFKKSRSFCTLIPEIKCLKILIVFGKEERAKTEEILFTLNPAVQKLYNEAKTYHDGKWLLLPLNDKIIEDVKRILLIKRKSKISK